MLSERAAEAVRELRQKLDAAALEALQAGFDWAECETPEPPCPSEAFMIRNIWEPAVETITIKAGKMPPGTIPPAGYRVIRHVDWVAAGMPGLLDRPPIDT